MAGLHHEQRLDMSPSPRVLVSMRSFQPPVSHILLNPGRLPETTTPPRQPLRNRRTIFHTGEHAIRSYNH